MHSRTFTFSGRTSLPIAACGAYPRSTPPTTRSASESGPPPTSAPPSTAASTSSTHTYPYRSTTKRSDLIDLNRHSSARGDDASNLSHPNYEKTSIAIFARCDRQSGAGRQGHLKRATPCLVVAHTSTNRGTSWSA